MLVDIIERRRSLRLISSRALNTSIYNDLIDAARMAPSCMNKQSWRYLFVDAQNPLHEKVCMCFSGNNYWAENAPLFIIAACALEDSCQLDDRRDYGLFELGLSVQNIILQGVSLDLIVHPIAGFDVNQLRHVCEIPMRYIIPVILVVGYPDEKSAAKRLTERHQKLEYDTTQVRLAFSDIASQDVWKFI